MQRSHDATRTLLVGVSISATLCVIASLVIWLSDGIRADWLGLRIRATDPTRPLLIGLTFLVVRLVPLRWRGFDNEALMVRRLMTPSRVVVGLCTAVFCTTLLTNYGVGAGADAFGYVSQADRWLSGALTVDETWALDAPWPHRPLSVASLGYRPALDRLATVPTYPPGLPLLFAGAKGLVGQCGIPVVIALMAALLVAATFGIGRRVATPEVGAAAAWLVATCPAMLYMMAQPMSDVPAAAMMALAIYCCLRPGSVAAGTAGLAMAVLLLIRPNLVPIVGAFVCWLVALDRQHMSWSGRLTRGVVFLIGVAPGAAGVALFNHTLYGSPFASGYGDLSRVFSVANIAANLHHYSTWLIQSQTPLLALGAVALAVPAHWLRKSRGIASASLLLLVVAGMTAIYAPYLVFDDWWYLRFLLPAWPAMAVGAAWLCTNRTGHAYSRVGLWVLVLVGGWGLFFAQTHAAFAVGRGDLRYVSAAHAVREMTPPDSVILTMQHSGTVSYYGGRHPLRYDWIEPWWLEDTVQWLNAHGHAVYVLLDDWELEPFRERFKDRPFGGLLEESLVFEQTEGSHVYLFAMQPDGRAPRTIPAFLPSAVRCCEPQR